MKRCPLLLLLILFPLALSAQKVGLVLSGGGAKGIAHIGVLKALEEHEIPIELKIQCRIKREAERDKARVCIALVVIII